MKIWCLMRDQFTHVKPVETILGNCARFVYDADWDPEKMLQEKPDVLLCVNDYPYDITRCLDAARAAGVPSLLLQDGILEWRCQYENPLFGAGGGAPQHQPVIADKIACLGSQSAWHIASWGNPNKVEVTGMPRLDHLAQKRLAPPKKPGSRILVMTSKNPGFTPEQKDITLQSLFDVKAELDSLSGVEVFWRVSKAIATELRIENQLEKICSLELTSLLEEIDAVITTPSTTLLETMLMERPVAALDYHNVPRFVQTAWTISAREHIRPVVAELLNPSASKSAFQKDCLQQNLLCDGRAAERVSVLLRRMVEDAQVSQKKKPATTFTFNSQEDRLSPVVQKVSLAALYPEASAFQECKVENLQVRLARAENENARLKAENGELKKGRHLSSWLRRGARHLSQIADRKS